MTQSSHYDVATGRAYVHSKCGEVTIVSGGDFAGICNPFEPCTGTICVECGVADSLSRFNWEDTGECVAAYRRRLRRAAPLSYRLWSWLIAPLLGALIGAIVAMFFEVKAPVFFRVALAIIGAVVMFLFIGPTVIRTIAGNRFYNTP